MKIRIFFHDKCFDGTASAALFSRFYRERIRPDAKFQFSGLVHRAGALFDEQDFDGDENVIVDFKYSPSPKIGWWFDHHQSAFLTPEDAEHYRKGDKSHKFYDPDFRSCTKFLDKIAQEKFGFDPAPVGELIEWADIVDGAQFSSPEMAVEMAAPALKLTMVIESTNDPGFLPRLIPLLVSEPLAKVIEEPFVAALIPPLMERHGKSIDILRQKSECKNKTIYFDVTEIDGLVLAQDHLFRRHGIRPRGIQQVHPLLPAPRFGLQRGAEQQQFQGQGRRGFESLDQGAEHGQPGQNLRAIWWRWTRPRGRYLLPSR